MVPSMATRSGPGEHPPGRRAPRRPEIARRLSMKWTTPTATDFRFGFEITMYIAAR